MYANRRCGMWLAALIMWCLSGSKGTAQVELREYQLKAVFLFNFAQFVEWPAGTFTGEQAPLVIGILGSDPFRTALDDTVRNELVGQRPLMVQRYKRVEDIDSYHILFISKSEAGQLERVVDYLKNRSILTVSDIDNSARHGVMIRFLTEKKKIRLRINPGAAKAAGLTLSSKLLRPAEIITTEQP